MGTPVAYLRKSRVTLASPGELSHEAQLVAVRELAARHGDPEPLILSDWSRSGRKSGRSRPQYSEMLRMIEAGEVSAVYSYSLSRLSRSVRDFASLVEVAQAHDVPVRLAKDTLNLGTASGRLNVNVLASVAAFEAEVAQERARDTITARRVRGDHVGSAPYGYVQADGKLEPDPERPIEPVIEAYRAAHTYSGAARLLNTSGATAPRGAKWSAPAVRRVVNRVLPETRSTDGKPGRRVRQDYMLSRLLRCPCGGVMTGRLDVTKSKYGTFGPYVRYQCFRARYEAEHPRPYMVTETILLPWLMDEAARLDPPGEDEAPAVVDVAERRAGIEETFRRVSRAYAAGGLTDSEYDDARRQRDDDLAGLDGLPVYAEIEPVDWSWQPETLNRVLRALWEYVQLGPDLRPVRAEWRIPEWRADD